MLGSGVMDVQSGGGEPVLVLTRNGGGTSLIVAINYGSSPEWVQAASPLANTLFKAAFGAIDSIASNGEGDLLFDVAPKSAVVYVSTP